jgi:hypothetical protein
MAKPVRGLRQVDIASATDQENRRLTTLRKEAGQTRTRNRQQGAAHAAAPQLAMGDRPPSGLPTLVGDRVWLKQVVLPEIDRLEMNHLCSPIWSMCNSV